MKSTKDLVVGIILMTLGMSMITFGIIYSINQKVNYTELAQLKKAELKYWETKSHLCDEVDNYIQKTAPTSSLSGVILVDKCEEYGVDIKLVLAQGHQESHFGTQGLASKTNSVWNVGAADSLTYAQIHKKHLFNHPNESIDPYLKYLTENYLTYRRTEQDLLNNFVDIRGSRYASSPTYEASLKYKYEVISQTTKIDSLQKVLQYWTIQSGREF